MLPISERPVSDSNTYDIHLDIKSLTKKSEPVPLPIKGYRKLSDLEIAFINESKSLGEEVKAILDSIDSIEDPLITESIADSLQKLQAKIIMFNIRVMQSQVSITFETAYGINMVVNGLTTIENYNIAQLRLEQFNQAIMDIKTGFMWVVRSIAKPETFI